ncbi:hypothetical protein [Cupriavidus sp. YR651]|uniref:hypothetical protein n=1 Tax=Cupriavidus sp. YR651 TaxID=1855315 RepID=UPI000B852929|nr:hypothetical protein [Cupriavidus sp. YR651]
MNDFWSLLSTPGWWVSVVIVGILINFASSFLQRWLAVFSERLARALDSRNAQAQEKRQALVDLIRSDARALYLMVATEQRHTGRAVTMLLMGVGLMIVSQKSFSGMGLAVGTRFGAFMDPLYTPVCLSLASMTILLTVMSVMQAYRCWSIIREATGWHVW